MDHERRDKLAAWLDGALQAAAQVLGRAEALLIGAGAGMGVDSGLPDFRGNHGFWRAYPPYQQLGLGFAQLANPAWFERDPSLAWGFYGHRLELYRTTPPHAGFQILRRWAGRLPHGAFVFTSNVDGHFQRSGFDPARVVEIHGGIDRLQCTAGCGAGLWDAGGVQLEIDPQSFRARPPFPACAGCGAIARPNILMFGDGDFDDVRVAQQLDRLDSWLDRVRGSRLVVVECGAGTAIPTVRDYGEGVAAERQATLIRINPRDPEVPPGGLSLPLGALAGLEALDRIRVS
jgi:NAD-dependent SIR2 family protein deacetylase